jgi:hypothetical protein
MIRAAVTTGRSLFDERRADEEPDVARRGRAQESADNDVPADRAEREDGCEGNSEAHGGLCCVDG